MTKCLGSLESKIEWFSEQAIRMDQSYKDGKTLISTQNMSVIMSELAKTVQLIKKDLDVLIYRK